MVDLAKWIQQNLREKVREPILIAAQPWANYAVVGSNHEAALYLLDRRQGKIVRRLSLPRRSEAGTDFREFSYSPDGLNVAAYDGKQKLFAAWSLADGELIQFTQGLGQIPPSIVFLSGGRLALCDGPRVNFYQLGTNNAMYSTPVSDDLRSLVMFPLPSPQPVLIGVGSFRKGLGGFELHSLRIENGQLVREHEGPARPRPEGAHDKKSVTVHELLNIPGSTARILIVSEEECLEKRAPLTNWEYDQEFSTRLLAVDPQTGRFLRGELAISGRHCLEVDGSELLLIDEMGRHRRVGGFPLRLENVDWRLSA
jgi:hypothetical protein